MRTKADVHRRL